MSIIFRYPDDLRNIVQQCAIISLDPLESSIWWLLQVKDEDSRHEGVEIERSSPFHLSRVLAKEFGYRCLDGRCS